MMSSYCEIAICNPNKTIKQLVLTGIISYSQLNVWSVCICYDQRDSLRLMIVFTLLVCIYCGLSLKTKQLKAIYWVKLSLINRLYYIYQFKDYI